MLSFNCVVGRSYVVTVTSVPLSVQAVGDDGAKVTLLSVSRSGQYFFVATGSRVEVSQDDAVVTPSFSGATVGLSANGGGAGCVCPVKVSSFDVVLEDGVDCYLLPVVSAASTVSVGWSSLGDVSLSVVTARLYFSLSSVVAVTWPVGWHWIDGSAPSLAVGAHCVAVERVAQGEVKANLCY
ncbi:MAG: hypothetical protein RR889_03605 [Akkermansia sp.]